jgi:SAM-dependent methyltransferase
MGHHPNHRYDIVFFSFNGLDCVTHEDRLEILQEIARIGKPGAWFYFTSHNLNWASNIFEWWRQPVTGRVGLVRRLKWLLLRYTKNFRVSTAKFRNARHLVFNDGAHHWSMQLYYIRPLEQIRQLKPLFDDIRVFSTVSGNELAREEDIAGSCEPYLGYLCRIK